jgi:hypothetical protein
MEEAKRIGEDYLALEKYVNLNYMVGGVWGGVELGLRGLGVGGGGGGWGGDWGVWG